MTVSQLIEQLKLLPQHKSIICQVKIDEDRKKIVDFYFMEASFSNWLVELKIDLPELKGSKND